MTKQIPALQSDIMDVKFLTVAEIAVMLRVSKMTVYRLCNSGDLESIRVGRSFRVAEENVVKYLGAAQS